MATSVRISSMAAHGRFLIFIHSSGTFLFAFGCDTVKIISPNHHLFSPHTFDFIVNKSSLYHLKTLVKVIYPYHTFLLCFSRFPCIGQWCFCCIHAIHHCMVWGTLLLVLFRYIYDPFTVTQNHLYVWVIW